MPQHFWTIRQFNQIQSLYESGTQTKLIAEQFRVSANAIRSLRRAYKWKRLRGHWINQHKFVKEEPLR